MKGPKISDTMLGTQKILRIFLQPRSKNCGTVGFVPFAFLPVESCVKNWNLIVVCELVIS